MSSFDEHDKAFEAQFLRQREMHFRIVARRNHLLGLWAAKCLGLWGKTAEDYALSVVDSAIVGRGDRAVTEKLTIDLWRCAIPVGEREIREQLAACDARAQEVILREMAAGEAREHEK